MTLINFILNFNDYLDSFISYYGQFAYFIIFAIVFFETGLVFLPFLPGDSLIFASGALAGAGKLDIVLLFVLLAAASIAGDSLNYKIGYHFGRRILEYKKVKLVSDKNLQKARRFVIKHGGKAVFLARFIPIVRTIVPFIVGMGKLNYKRFIRANAAGGIVWVTLFLGMGYFFGNTDTVKNNFSLIILAIVIISVTPVIFSYFISLFKKTKTYE